MKLATLAEGDAEAIRAEIVSQLRGRDGGGEAVFRGRSAALIGAIAPALVWLRDEKNVTLTTEVVRFSLELRCIWKLAIEKIVLLRDRDTGAVTEIDVSDDIPDAVTWPLRSYLGEVPGYHPGMPLEGQAGSAASTQHFFVLMYLPLTLIWPIVR